MAVWVRVAGSVRVLVFVLVEYDLQAPAERISDAAQRLQAWNMIAAFEARDHGFCHPKSLRQLLLSLACMSAKLEQAVSALGGDCDAVIRQALSPSGRAGCALAGSAKVSDARFRRLSIDRFWREADIRRSVGFSYGRRLRRRPVAQGRAMSSGCTFSPPAISGFDGSKRSRTSRFLTSERATTKASFRLLACRSATLKKALPK